MKHILVAVLLAVVAVGNSQEAAPQDTSPVEINAYKLKAAYAAELVITQVDEIKAFQKSPEFNDLFTSTAVQAQYEDRLTSFSNTLRMVQDELLSTATGVLIGAQNQLNAAKQMIKYSDNSY